MKRLALATIALTLFGCDELSSSLSSPIIEPQQKPAVCSINFKESCWTSTMQEITKCAGRNEAVDQFSQDRRICTNIDGKIVEFDNHQDLFSKPFDILQRYFSLSLSPSLSSERCMILESEGRNQNIILSEFAANPIQIRWDEDQFSFTCLDGQQIVVDRQEADDCLRAGGNQIPSLQLQSVLQPTGESTSEDVVQLVVSGGQGLEVLFSCE